MLLWVVPFFALTSLALSVATITKTPFEDNLSKVAFSIIIFLYILGIFQVNLLLGIVFISCLVVASLYYNIKKTRYIPFGLIYYSIFFLIAIFLTYDRYKLQVFDEIYHWAVAAKNMYILDALHTAMESNTPLKSYTPGITIFQYFWLKLSFSSFKEPILYISNIMLAATCLIVPLKKFNGDKGQWKEFIFFCWIIFWIPILIIPEIFSLYSFLGVDILLGIVAGYLWYLVAQKKIDFIGFFLGSIVLILIKESGVIFIIPSFCVLAIKLIQQWKNINISQKIYYLLSPCFIVVTSFSWKYHLESLNINEVWSWKFNFQFIIDVLTKPELIERKNILISYFLSAFSTDQIIVPSAIIKHSSFYFSNFEFAYIFWVMLIFYFFYVIGILTHKAKDILYVLRIVFIGNIVYFFLTSCLYIFPFSVGEGKNLSSYSRYLNSYLTAMLVLFTQIFMQYFSWSKAKNTVKVCFLLLLILAPSYNIFAKNILFHKAQKITDPFAQWNYQLPPDSTIYPYKANFASLCYYTAPTKIITGFYESENFEVFLKNPRSATHVFIGGFDDSFVEKYKQYFIDPIVRNGLYEVNLSANEAIQLRHVYSMVQ